VGVRVGVAYSRNKLALRAAVRNQYLKSQFSIIDSFRDMGVHIYNFLKFVGGLWAWQTFFWPIVGVEETNIFPLKN